MTTIKFENGNKSANVHGYNFDITECYERPNGEIVYKGVCNEGRMNGVNVTIVTYMGKVSRASFQYKKRSMNGDIFMSESDCPVKLSERVRYTFFNVLFDSIAK